MHDSVNERDTFVGSRLLVALDELGDLLIGKRCVGDVLFKVDGKCAPTTLIGIAVGAVEADAPDG